MTSRSDVLVIGGGIYGCALAYYLRGMGRSVTVLERDGVGHEGSGRNSGGVRQQGRARAEIPLAIEAIAMWDRLADELGSPTEYVRGGNLLVGSTDAQVARLEGRLARQVGFDLDSRILTGVEARALCAILAPQTKAALYCPVDGHANPLLATIAYARAARARGAVILEGHAACDVERRGSSWVVTTEHGAHEAELVVNVAGPAAVQICELVGISLPILNARVQTMVTERVPSLFPQFVQEWDTKTFTRQTQSGNIIYGSLTEDYVITGHEVFSGDCVRATRAAVEAFPSYAELNVIRAWGGVLDVSLDLMPIIGELPGCPGFFVVAGTSGHGFGLAPAASLHLARWVADGERSAMLEPFSPNRFSMAGTVDNIDDGGST